MKKCSFLLSIPLILFGCKSIVMQKISVNIVLQKQISNLKAGEDLPVYLIKLIKQIECEDTVYIPQLIITRTDLPNEKPLQIEVPSITENIVKKWASLYDYNNLQEDYNENLPKLKVDNYLVKPGNLRDTRSKINISTQPDDVILSLDASNKNSTDSIINILFNTLCTNRTPVKRVIISLSITNEATFTTLTLPQLETATINSSEVVSPTIEIKNAGQGKQTPPQKLHGNWVEKEKPENSKVVSKMPLNITITGYKFTWNNANSKQYDVKIIKDKDNSIFKETTASKNEYNIANEIDSLKLNYKYIIYIRALDNPLIFDSLQFHRFPQRGSTHGALCNEK